MAQWYYHKNSQVKGPVSFDEMSDMVKRGELQLSDLVYRDGEVRWQVLVEVPGIEKRKTKASSLKDHIEFPDVNELKDRHWILLVKEAEGGETRFIQKGPYDVLAIKDLLKKEEIKYGDYAWRPGFTDWEHIGALKEFDRRLRGNQVEDPAPVIVSPAKGEAKSVELQNEWIRSTDKPEEALGEDLVASSGVQPLIPPKPKLPPSLPVVEKKRDPEVAKPKKAIPAIEKKVPRSQPVVAKEAKAPPPREEKSPRPQRSSVPFGVPQSAQEPIVSWSEKIEPVVSRGRELLSIKVQLGHRSIPVSALVIVFGFAVVVASQLKEREQTSHPLVTSEVDEFLPVKQVERQAPAQTTGQRSELSSRRSPQKIAEQKTMEPKAVDSVKKVQRKTAPPVSGKDSFIKLSELTAKHLVIKSNAPVGSPVLLVLEGKVGQVLDSPGYLASRTLKQRSNGQIRIDYQREKIPHGAYRLEVRTSRQKIVRNIHVGTAKAHRKRLKKERKRWAYQRNREKQKLFYKSKELESIMDQLARRKLTKSRALSKLRGMKTNEVYQARKTVIRDLAFPGQWKKLREYVINAEKMLKNQQSQKRILASDSAKKLRAQIRSLKQTAGSLSVY